MKVASIWLGLNEENSCTRPETCSRLRPLHLDWLLPERRVAYGIPVSVHGLAEGEVSKASDNYVGGKSTMGVGYYSGPCTPPNTSPHHYTFILIATDFDPKELPPGLTRDDVIAKFGPPPAHLKGTTGMVGLFVNPWHE
jgi:hypothetical protein